MTPDQMVAKLCAALESRDDSEYLMIVARTDAALIEGVDGALKRAERYLAAGADAIFVAGLETPEQLRRVGEALRGAHQIAVVGERRIRHWPAPDELYAMGFGMVNYPGLLINRVHAAMADGLDALTRIASGQTAPADIPDNVAALEAMAGTLDLAAWEGVSRRFERN